MYVKGLALCLAFIKHMWISASNILLVDLIHATLLWMKALGFSELVKSVQGNGAIR